MKYLNVMEDVMFCTPFKVNICRLSKENHPEEKSPPLRSHLTMYIFDCGVHPLGEYTSFSFVIPSPRIHRGNNLTFTFHFKHFTWLCCCCWVFFRNWFHHQVLITLQTRLTPLLVTSVNSLVIFCLTTNLSLLKLRNNFDFQHGC